MRKKEKKRALFANIKEKFPNGSFGSVGGTGKDVEEGGGARGLHVVGVRNGGEMEEDEVGEGGKGWGGEVWEVEGEEWARRGFGGRGRGRVMREERGGGEWLVWEKRKRREER
ncbi:hypothetical protein AAC387_Pa07g0036 [Persea americana]